MQYAYVGLGSQYCWIPFKLTNILQNKLWSYHRLRIVLDRTFVSRTSNFKPLSKPAKSPNFKPVLAEMGWTQVKIWRKINSNLSDPRFSYQNRTPALTLKKFRISNLRTGFVQTMACPNTSWEWKVYALDV